VDIKFSIPVLVCKDTGENIISWDWEGLVWQHCDRVGYKRKREEGRLKKTLRKVHVVSARKYHVMVRTSVWMKLSARSSATDNVRKTEKMFFKHCYT
jgi:hypothetical protein